jgi:hypothetical protein
MWLAPRFQFKIFQWPKMLALAIWQRPVFYMGCYTSHKTVPANQKIHLPACVHRKQWMMLWMSDYNIVINFVWKTFLLLRKF